MGIDIEIASSSVLASDYDFDRLVDRQPITRIVAIETQGTITIDDASRPFRSETAATIARDRINDPLIIRGIGIGQTVIFSDASSTRSLLQTRPSVEMARLPQMFRDAIHAFLAESYTDPGNGHHMDLAQLTTIDEELDGLIDFSPLRFFPDDIHRRAHRKPRRSWNVVARGDVEFDHDSGRHTLRFLHQYLVFVDTQQRIARKGNFDRCGYADCVVEIDASLESTPFLHASHWNEFFTMLGWELLDSVQADYCEKHARVLLPWLSEAVLADQP